MVSRLIDGSKVLNTKYFNTIVREIILELLQHVSVDRTLASGHFLDLKDKVVHPSLILLESEPYKLPPLQLDMNYVHGIDTGLLNDFLENHYPRIKSLWKNVVLSIEKRNSTNSKIDKTIEAAIKDKLDEIGIKYKFSMYGLKNSHINAIPIKEVRERLRNLIENKTFDSDIDSKLTVEHHTTSSTINFYEEQHPDIYKVYESEDKKYKYH
jgi:hypothetical protein